MKLSQTDLRAEEAQMKRLHKLFLIVSCLGFGFMAYKVMAVGTYVNELSTTKRAMHWPRLLQ